MVETAFDRPREIIVDSHTPGGSGTTTTVRVAPSERVQSTTGATKERRESPGIAESQAAGITKPVLIIER
jgi:hypothetical protein